MITKLLNTLSLFFGVSKSEVRGMILLLIFCVLLLVIPFVQKAVYISQTHAFNIVVDTNATTSSSNYNAAIYSHESEETQMSNLQKLERPVSIHTISKDQLDSLGLQGRLLYNITKYLEKGGKFRKPQDLNKIYGMDKRSAAHLVANTLWDSPQKHSYSSIADKPAPKPVQMIDINTADTVTLQTLKGIGHVLAARILKYRDKLGGFVSIDQLREVYGISEYALGEIFQRTFVADNFTPRLLYINKVTLDQLSAHPYIGYKKSKVIYNYLKNHSKLADFEDFRKSYPFTDKELGFIKYYITYE